MIDFDEIRGTQVGTNEKNWLRHGVSNAESDQVFSDDPLFIAEPPEQLWGELRYHAYGQTTEGRNLFVVFTLRQDITRIISVRDINRRERRNYDDAQESNP
ncbi:MAG: BrnT family toxin [Chloroflexi bacterium]|nr:BrnT family toxin [Chloroflexota bacterium]